MKKFILLLSLFIILSCSSNQNRGYGYNTRTEIPVESAPVEQIDSSSTPVKKSTRKWYEKHDDRIMKLYDTSGEYWTYITAYKGEYDGVEFYVFKNDESIVVIPVSMCK